MVIGHSGCPKFMFQFIYLFHMPFFFFVSGYFFKADKVLRDGYVFSKFKTLWFPFVKWSIVFLLLHNLLYKVGVLDTFLSIITIIKRVCLIPFMYGDDELIGGFWFIKDLFYATLFMIGLCSLPSIRKYGDKIISNISFIGSFIVFGVSLFLYCHNHSVAFRELCIMSSSLCFFITGYFISCNDRLNHIIMMPVGGGRLLILFAFLLAITWLLPVSKPYESLDFYYAPWILFAALCGIVFVLDLSSVINNTIVRIPFVYIGEHTMSILIWHFSVFKVVSLIYVLVYGLPIPIVGIGRHLDYSIYMQGFGWLIYSVAGVCLPILIPYFYSRYKKDSIE